MQHTSIEEEWAEKEELCRRACAQLDLTFSFVDPENYLVKITRGEKKLFLNLQGLPTPNLMPLHKLARDKVFTKYILRDADITVARGEHFFVSGKGDWVSQTHVREDAFTYADRIGYPVFVKPHNKARGLASGIAHTPDELARRLSAVARESHMALVEEVCQGREGRIFCFDGVVEFLYFKIANTSGVGNLSAGGTLVDYQDSDIPRHYIELGTRVHEAFGGGLRTFAVDFFEGEDSHKIVVLEVNGQPSLAGIYAHGEKDKALEIWVKTLHAYFA